MSTTTTTTITERATQSATADAPLAAANPARPRPILLWSLLAGFVLLQLGAWTAWLIVASHHRVDEVPLATGAGVSKKP